MILKNQLPLDSVGIVETREGEDMYWGKKKAAFK